MNGGSKNIKSRSAFVLIIRLAIRMHADDGYVLKIYRDIETLCECTKGTIKRPRISTRRWEDKQYKGTERMKR